MSIDNEVTLVKKINSYYKEQLEKKVNFNIDLELDFFCRYETEKEKLIDLDIIIGNKIDCERYGIWRQFKRKDTIDSITYTDIKKLSIDLKKAKIHMKQILYSDGLISIIPKACIFDNYEELQLYAIVLSHGETKFNKLKGLIDSSIKLNNNNGNIIVEGNIIGTINLDNLPGKFFKYLFDYKGIYRSHEDIINEINPGTRSKTYGAQCSEIKSDLSKSIKNLIKSKKGYYIIK